MNTHILTLSIAFLMSFIGINSGDKKEAAMGITIEVNQPGRNIVINANDQMRFDTNEIKVKAGEKVKITLNHTGKLPKNVMGHNFVLLTKGTDVATFAPFAMNEQGIVYIPSSGVITRRNVVC